MAKKENDLVENVDFTPVEGLTKADFTFVHDDKNVKIHDEALKSKPTTFVKDAFKRFCKNKSSVVGAIIIGILLLGSFFVPILSPYDIKTVQPSLALLDPKLFNAGSGFWDGSVEFKDQPWDGTYENEEGTYPSEKYAIGKPAGDFESRAVMWNTVKVTDVQYYSGESYKYASGGYMIVTHDNNAGVAGKNSFYQNYTSFPIAGDYNYKLSIEFANFDGIEDSGLPFNHMQLSDTRVLLVYGNSLSELNAGTSSVVLADWAKHEEKVEFDLSSEVASANYCRIRIEGKPTEGTVYKYFALKNAVISAEHKTEGEEVPEEVTTLLEDISVLNANFTLYNDYEKDEYGINTANKSIHYWQSNGMRRVFRAEIQKVNFRYDQYEAVLGTRAHFVIGGSLFETYKKKGWCTYDSFANLHTTFKVLDKKCPVVEVNEAGSHNIEYDAWQYDCKVVYYKYLGFSKMPKFILGTDASGFDIFTKALNCLKTSLLVAVISSAVCLIVGLIWGSISGYFGGTVDLVMERITDIISGVPWIVMMTLIILLLGNNIVTFAVALIMTGWIGTASRTRTQFYRFKRREYVLASRTLGASDWRLIFRHILPNSLGTIVTSSVLMIPGCIFSEASISYLGLGLKGVDSFGVLLSDNQRFLSTHPALIVFPSIIISLLMISFNLFGNGLRDALNPALKGED